MLRSTPRLAFGLPMKCSTSPRPGPCSQIPTSAGFPFIGTSLALGAAGGAPRLHEYIDSRHKAMGPIFRENMGAVTAVFISDPSLIRKVFLMEGKFPEHFVPKAWTLYNKIHQCKRGLFFMDGEEWYKYRKLMNKYFLSPGSINELKGLHAGIVEHLIQRWKQYDDKEIEDLEHEFYRHSISFILGSLIGSSYFEKIADYSGYVDELARKFQLVFETSSKLNVLPSVKLVQLLRLQLWETFQASVTSSMEASKKVVNMALKDLSPNGLLHKLASENISEDLLSAIVADLLIAAGDTTAFTSQWAVYLLGKDTNVQEAVYKDPSLIKGVIRETLRLYPSAPFISRILPNDEIIGGFKFHKNELVLFSLYTCGREDRLYPSADRFLPERWIKDTSRKYQGVNDVNSFLPFAMGARSCIGARLANAQLQMTINQVVQNYEFSTQEDVDMILRLVPVPSKPVRIIVKSRRV